MELQRWEFGATLPAALVTLEETPLKEVLWLTHGELAIFLTCFMFGSRPEFTAEVRGAQICLA